MAERVAVLDYGNLDFIDRAKASSNVELTRLIVGLFVTTTDENGEFCVVLQRRSKHKKEFPDCLTFLVSGHVDEQDMYHVFALPQTLLEALTDTALLRESFEEIGITIEKFDETRCFDSEIRENNIPAKQMHIKTICIDRSVLGELRYNPEEVDGIEVVPLKKIIEQIKLSPEEREAGFEFTTPFEEFMRLVFNKLL
ncbi:NUDIX domain-containing protein [Candidatus Beckwithbacteria bacterium]|nr:NUDIX domain-containing protein [Candidatus Beckwithbacteria bacterium]